ncbi:translation initiation factor [Neorhodopirellula pilleata]|uniref:Translation initiation factor Sui1 n=1 Tax=Neorhodopirellula pilleata TaxID=2714738 RepID=A0A5C6ACW5_9BACT|nr:translation initiation factor [Neorhodopirellula pilleata]TWT97449.1 translation initiation factor Sui1 [Neorhodopirellula pilleata]
MTRLFAGTPFDIPPTCDTCGKVEPDCICTPEQKAAAERTRQAQARLREVEAARLPPEKQTARLRVETRKGKRTVTVIDGLTAHANDLPTLLSKLQAACGTGGTVREEEDRLELQGDHRQSAGEHLTRLGYRVKNG